MPFRRLPALGALRAFEAAARHGAFKAAAGELAVTPGAVSQQIRTLEEDLGVKLFTRAVRAVSLTNEGRRLQPALTAAFMQIREAVDQVRPRPDIALTVESSGPIIRKWLLPRLHRFSESFPEWAVNIKALAHLSDFNGDGPDVAVRMNETPAPNLFTLKLCGEHLLPLASPDLVARLDLRQPADLARAPLLHDTSPQVFEHKPDWAHWFRLAGLDPAAAERGMRFDPYAADHALDAAVNGAGVVLGRRFLARNDMLEGRLVNPFGPVVPMHASYFVVCRDGEQTRPEVASFINWVTKEAAAVAKSASLEDTAH